MISRRVVRGVLLPGAPDRAFIILIVQQSCFSQTAEVVTELRSYYDQIICVNV